MIVSIVNDITTTRMNIITHKTKLSPSAKTPNNRYLRYRNKLSSLTNRRMMKITILLIVAWLAAVAAHSSLRHPESSLELGEHFKGRVLKGTEHLEVEVLKLPSTIMAINAWMKFLEQSKMNLMQTFTLIATAVGCASSYPRTKLAAAI
ncbi:hypothetical protein ACHAWU_009305 [Discostella pseudostelligera]|uniref:Uncharacterized protein n=1 Tax=Discostella pseudostelligera TaxID=259834 RepID=A0ABD3MBK8_9STRA